MAWTISMMVQPTAEFAQCTDAITMVGCGYKFKKMKKTGSDFTFVTQHITY